MIITDIEQGSEEWRSVRRGVPTASCFDMILTATKLQRSASFEKYMHHLAAESVGIYEEWEGNKYTERGIEFEPQAAVWYEITNDVSLETAGFVWRDDRKLVGCSPDRLVGVDGGAEFKCPKATVQISRLKDGRIPAEYLGQVYGCLWVTGRKWWDFMSYHPEFRKQLEIRVTVDDPKYQAWLAKWEPEIEAFCARLEEVKIMVREWCGQ